MHDAEEARLQPWLCSRCLCQPLLQVDVFRGARVLHILLVELLKSPPATQHGANLSCTLPIAFTEPILLPFSPLLHPAVKSNPDPALGASCISAQRCCWNKASISALSFHTAPGFQPSACKALHWDLFQHCQEYAAHSSVSSGSIPEPLAVGKRCQVLVPPVPQEGAPSSHPRTYPTDSARGFVDSSETKTWQANLWSAGCLVMNPKYLRVNRASEIGLADRQK